MARTTLLLDSTLSLYVALGKCSYSYILIFRRSLCQIDLEHLLEVHDIHVIIDIHLMHVIPIFLFCPL